MTDDFHSERRQPASVYDIARNRAAIERRDAIRRFFKSIGRTVTGQ